ncbi:hypothetical protein P8C59_003444 [Phyllachora maydis]|uniref:Integrase catalytic domain-containing protein n=1 Tax=Phyllachora maydis TaxID=1825666 RepID=A0AAD9I091_9PEZI|nr:hypothetical protein P8C59_003444 [Phyllachora maydis]
MASLTNSSNAAAATTGKTSYSPRFDPFSGTIDLDSPLCPPRKEPYLGPAVNSATSNLDPPIDIGSKEGFKDTITSSIVKELSKKAYTIPDNSKLSAESNFEQWIQALSIVLRALGISNFLENPDISNTYSDSDQAVLLMLLRNSLSSSPRAAILWNYIPSKALKLLARMLGLIASSLNIEYLMADILEESRNPAIEAYRAAYIANSSNSTPNSNSNPSKKGKNKKKALKGYKKRKDFKGKGLKTSSNNKAKYKDNQPRRRPRDPALYNSWLYDTGSIDHISNSKERFTTFTPNTGQLRPINTGNSPISPASIGSIILEVLSRKAPPTYTKLVLDNVLYLPNININIISRVRHYDSGGCLIKETLYRGDRRCIAVLDFKKSGFFLDVKGSSKPILHANFAFPLGLSSYTTKSIEEPKPLTGTRDLPYMLRELVIKGNKVVEKAISSPTLKEHNIGQRDYYNLLNLAKLWHVRLGHIGLRLLKKTSSITKGLPNFDKIKEADFHCSSYNRGKAVRRVSKALIPDLPRVLDLIEGDTVKIRPRPYNRNPIVLLLVNRKSRYRWVFNLPNKSGPIVANAIKGFFRGLRNGFGRYPTKFYFNGGTEITDLLTTWLAKRGIKFSTSAPYIHEQNGLVERSVRVILDRLSRSLNRPIKSHLNAAKNLFKYLNSTKDYSICFSYNGNTVADLGPKLSNSSNTTTKLSRGFHSKEGPRPLTTTSTTIVDSRNSKGSSRTSIINSSLVPIGFSDSDFAGDKATSKSTYGYLYKLASRPISWKTKRATTIALSTLEAETNGLIEAIREVQWIIGLFSELYRPIDHPITLYRDNQGSITVANNPALHARTKHTLLKFRYVREQVKAKIVTIIYLNTKYMPANGLTKALPVSGFQSFIRLLGL